MAGIVRTKRISDPLDGRVRDRLVGRDQSSELRHASSGSEHSGSPCLSELVHGFLEDDDNESETRLFPDHDSESDRSDSASDRFLTADSLSCSNADPYRNLLLAHVAAAATEVPSEVRQNKAAFRRSVMAYLRELGHNAAICKTRWEASPGGSVPAGSYEFIDAVDRRSSKRFFVDLDFAAEFQIARPSPHYSRLFQSLPRCFVGDGDDLRRIIREICDAAKRSLKITELSLPPWRKNRYMQAKFFGPYRRTMNLVSESSFSSAALSAVKSRCVGFDGGAVNVSANDLVRTR